MSAPNGSAPCRWLFALAVLGLIGAFIAQGLAALTYCSQTYDEAAYLSAGYSHVARGDFRLMPEHPPLVKEVMALPLYLAYRLPFEPDGDLWAGANQWPIARQFLYGSGVPAGRLLELARLVNLGLGVLLVALMSWWAYRLWGRAAALVALALGCLEPNLVAHSALATVDVGATLFWLLTLYLLWEYAGSSSVWALLGVGVATGAALATKYSDLLLLGPIAVGLLMPPGRACLAFLTGRPHGRPRDVAGSMVLAVVSALVVACAAVLVLGLAYQGEGLSTWWHGLWLQRIHQQQGSAAFLWGHYSDSGCWFYFPVAFVIKTPLGSLFLVAAALVLFRKGKRFAGRDVVFLLLPVVLYFAAFAFVRVNIGVRYVLPVYPLVLVAASRLATVRFSRAWLAPALVGIPLILTAVSALRVTPHQLAYFNELVGGPTRGHLYLSDSNVDWGQDLNGLRRFMEHEGVSAVYLSYFGTAPPAAYGIRAQSLPGCGLSASGEEQDPPPVARLPRQLLAISVVNLQGVFLADKTMYAWLRDERTPVARIGYSIFVYDLTGDSGAHAHLAEIYEDEGRRDLGEAERAAARPAASTHHRAATP
jgi:hypothetical protein